MIIIIKTKRIVRCFFVLFFLILILSLASSSISPALAKSNIRTIVVDKRTLITQRPTIDLGLVRSPRLDINQVGFIGITLPPPYFGEEVVFIPNGEGTNNIRIISGSEERLPIGPNALTIDEEGFIYIIDTQGHKLINISKDGDIITEVIYDDSIGAVDIAVKNHQIFLLDLNNMSIHEIDSSGNELRKIQVPLYKQISRINFTDYGRLLVTGIYEDLGFSTNQEHVFKESSMIFDSSMDNQDSTTITKADGIGTVNGIYSSTLLKTTLNKGVLSIVGQDGTFALDVQSQNGWALGSAELIDFDRFGNIFILITSISQSEEGAIQSNSQIAKFDSSGKYILAINILNSSYTHPYERISLDEEGNLYQLITSPKGVYIIRWTQTPSLGVVDINEFNSKIQREINNPESYSQDSCFTPQKSYGFDLLKLTPNPMTESTISRDQVITTASNFASHSWSVGSSNFAARTCNNCPVGPSHWSIGTQVTGVAYMWGGFDSVSDFDSKLAQGYLAGDVTGTICTGSGCATGVDCSGFVSRAWGLSTKYSTRSLPDISTQINTNDLKKGDILDKSDSHVVLFSYFNGSGSPVYYESAYGEPSKVWLNTTGGWGYVTNYIPYRYNNISDGNIGIPLPSGTTFCANEGGYCSFSGTATVYYGANYSYYYKENITNGIDCNNATFGDPANGTAKSCYYKLTTQQCNPNADQAAFYENSNYGGNCIVKNIGNYTNPSEMGIANDSVSSVKVGGNVKLTLCRDDNYIGTCETFTGDDSDLSNNSIGDNQASSAKVENRSSFHVLLYSDANYTGSGCGFTGVGAGNVCSGFNDVASSIWIESGWSSRVWVDGDFNGASRCFTSSVSDFSGLQYNENGSGNLNDSVSSFAAYNQTSCPSLIQTSTTTITSDSPDPSVVNQAYTLGVTVSGSYGTPTGSVTVGDGSASCTATLSGGSGSCSLTSTTSGTKTLTANYSGNTTYNSSSDTESHTVNKATSTTGITSDSPDPSVVNQAYTVGVTVSGSYGTPTGSVTVGDGSASCTATLSNGSGSCSLTSTTSGTKILTASYGGNTTYNSSSGTTSHTVNKATSTTMITSDSPDPSVVNQAYTVGVTVSGSYGTPTGSVSVSDGSTSCTISNLSGGSGNCSLSSTTAGTKTLTATYGSDSTYNGSTDTESHQVNNPSGQTSTTTITSDSPDPSVVNQAYTVGVTVSGSYGTPTGTVTVGDGSSSCTVTLSGGSGSCSLTSTTTGTKTLTATYGGNSTYNSSSGTTSHTVNKATSTTTITSDSPDPSVVNLAYTVGVTVSGSYETPTGNVAVTDGSASCTATLSGGSGSCSLTSTTSGTKTLIANYSGNTIYNSSSDTESHLVNEVTGDNYEPDNTYDQANEIISGVTQVHSIVPAGDIDWVKFTLSETSGVTLETSGTTSADTVITLYDSGLTPIETSDDEGEGAYSYLDFVCGEDELPAGTYYLRIFEYYGDEISSYNIAFNTTGGCPMVPPTPENFRVTGSTLSSITIAWDDVSGETGYKIYRWGAIDGVWDFYLYASLGENSVTYSDTGLDCGSDYYYEVSANNTFGESEHAGWVMGTTADCSIPPIPTGVSATDGTYTDRVQVNWNSSEGATAYDVYRNTSTDLSSATYLGEVTGLSYSDFTATPGTTYWYFIQACNSEGCSNFSTSDSGYRAVSAQVPIPKSPVGTIYTRTPTYKWTRVSNATKYQYQLWKGSVQVYSKTPTTPTCDALTCKHKPATILGYGLYKWRVRAYVGGVWTPWSVYKSFTIARSATPE